MREGDMICATMNTLDTTLRVGLGAMTAVGGFDMENCKHIHVNWDDEAFEETCVDCGKDLTDLCKECNYESKIEDCGMCHKCIARQGYADEILKEIKRKLDNAKQQNKKYPSCSAERGVWCSRHQAFHRNEKKVEAK